MNGIRTNYWRHIVMSAFAALVLVGLFGCDGEGGGSGNHDAGPDPIQPVVTSVQLGQPISSVIGEGSVDGTLFPTNFGEVIINVDFTNNPSGYMSVWMQVNVTNAAVSHYDWEIVDWRNQTPYGDFSFYDEVIDIDPELGLYKVRSFDNKVRYDSAVNSLPGDHTELIKVTAWSEDGHFTTAYFNLFLVSTRRFTEPLIFDVGLGHIAYNKTHRRGLAFANNGEVLIVSDQEQPDGYTGKVHVYIKNGGSWTYLQTLSSTDPTPTGNMFGHSIAVSGDTLVVGSPHENEHIEVEGSVHVYEWNGTQYEFVQWIQPTITGTSNQNDDEFGCTVDIDGEWMIIGSPWADAGADETDDGAVWFYERVEKSNWEYRQGPLRMSNTRAGDWLGYTLEIKGTNAFVGAIMWDGALNNKLSCGGVWWLTRTDGIWSEVGNIEADPSTGDVEGGRFGYSIVLDNSLLVISRPYWNGQTNNLGRVNAYKLNDGTWKFDSKAVATLDRFQIGDRYGRTIDFSYPYLIVGCFTYGHDPLASFYQERDGKGLADVWRYNGASFDFVQALHPTSLQYGDYFGMYVAIDGTNFAVTAPGIGNLTDDAKTIRVFYY